MAQDEDFIRKIEQDMKALGGASERELFVAKQMLKLQQDINRELAKTKQMQGGGSGGGGGGGGSFSDKQVSLLKKDVAALKAGSGGGGASAGGSASGMLGKLRGGMAGVAGVAGPVAAITKAIFDVLQSREDSNLQAQKMFRERANESFEFARDFRRDLSDGTTNMLMKRKQDIDAPIQEIGMIHDFMWGNERNERIKQFRQETNDTIYKSLRTPVGRVFSEQQLKNAADMTNALNSKEVEGQFTWKQKGIFGWLKSNTIDRLTGQRQDEEEQAAMKLAQRRLKGMEQRLKDEERRQKEDVVFQLNERNRGNLLAAWEKEAAMKLGDWNPY